MLTNRATRLRSVKVTKHGIIRYVSYGFLLVCYSNFIPKMFDFQKCHGVEVLVRGHSRSFKVVYHPTDRVWFPISVL